MVSRPMISHLTIKPLCISMLHGIADVSIAEAPVRGGVGNPPGLTQPPTGPGWARPRDSLTPSHAPGYSLTPPPGDHSRRRRRRRQDGRRDGQRDGGDMQWESVGGRDDGQQWLETDGGAAHELKLKHP